MVEGDIRRGKGDNKHDKHDKHGKPVLWIEIILDIAVTHPQEWTYGSECGHHPSGRH